MKYLHELYPETYKIQFNFDHVIIIKKHSVFKDFMNQLFFIPLCYTTPRYTTLDPLNMDYMIAFFI